MQISDQGLAFIAAHEGFVSRGYLDPAGVITIGYGFTMRSEVFAGWWLAHQGRPLKVGDRITRRDADQILRRLIAEEYAPPVTAALKGTKHAHAQPVFDACVSVVYNLGARALTWKWALALVNGNLGQAAARLRETGTTAAGRRLAGLVSRRLDEANLLETGDYGLVRHTTPITDAGVREAQKSLQKLGYVPGDADGIDGPLTRRAVKAFQKDYPPLLVDGRIGPATLAALKRARSLRRSLATTIGTGVSSGLGVGILGFDWETLLTAGLALAVLAAFAVWLWHYRGRLPDFLTLFRWQSLLALLT